MDAPPDVDASTVAFVRMTGFLRKAGFSAPKVLSEDNRNGFVLLEDLGDELLSTLIAQNLDLRPEFSEKAVDFLVELHGVAPPALPAPTPADMTGWVLMVRDWYPGVETSGFSTLCASLETVLGDLDCLPRVTSLRDFHAGNLVWLPDRTGPSQIGLLDYQDAFLGPPAYDLVSLVTDVRLPMDAGLIDTMTNRYINATGTDPEIFAASVAANSFQRNLRILGIFARLAIRDGKPGYLTFLPNVWAQLEHALRHPWLKPLRAPFAAAIPLPNTVSFDQRATR